MKRLLIGLAAAALSGAATAQPYQGPGDYYSHQASGWDFPEFRNVSWHIRNELRTGLREGWLDPDQADDFTRQLHRIQAMELAEYHEHGWGLPEADRNVIRARFSRLDGAVDAARDGRGGDRWRASNER
jgi:hypothetical protein